MVYTNENRFLVANANNILQSHGIAVTLKNEYATGGIGDLSPLDAWVELWVINDEDYATAVEIIEHALSATDAPEWHCPKCGEQNDSAFDFCWHCQAPKPIQQ